MSRELHRIGQQCTVFSRLNARPLLNAGIEKTPDKNCRFLNKRRGRLMEKKGNR